MGWLFVLVVGSLRSLVSGHPLPTTSGTLQPRLPGSPLVVALHVVLGGIHLVFATFKLVGWHAPAIVAIIAELEDCSSQRVLMPEGAGTGTRAYERTLQVGIEALLLIQPLGPH